jgi:hypothetical protein
VTQQLLLLIVGFVLTSVAGGALGSWFQRRAWAHQHEIQLRDEERQREVQRRDEEHLRALKTFEEVSQLLDRRLYRMRRLYWAAREVAAGTGDLERLAAARADYRAVLTEWNDNLNRNLALIETYFGTPARNVMSGQIYEGFAALGRGLEEIVKMASATGGSPIEVPRFGYRVTRLSRAVYALNLQMLRQLRDDSVGRAAPQEVSQAVAQEKRPLRRSARQLRRRTRLLRQLRAESPCSRSAIRAGTCAASSVPALERHHRGRAGRRSDLGRSGRRHRHEPRGVRRARARRQCRSSVIRTHRGPWCDGGGNWLDGRHADGGAAVGRRSIRGGEREGDAGLGPGPVQDHLPGADAGGVLRPG